jgi:hypothetical protein
MLAGPFLWVALAMASVTAASKCWYPCGWVCLFVFLPPLVGPELEHECGVVIVFCRCPAANLKLLRTKGPDKLGVGIT